jgi:D-alanine-D-alanine ligase
MSTSHAASLRVAVLWGGPSSEAEVSRRSAASVSDALRNAGHHVDLIPIDRDLPQALVGCEVVFPVAHGAFGEDGGLQGVLEWLALPYVGSDVLGSALAMHKALAKVHFTAAQLPLARGVTCARADLGIGVDLPIGLLEEATPPSSVMGKLAKTADEMLRALGPALVVKPVDSGSAIGVERLPAARTETLTQALWTTLRRGQAALVEEFVRGRELTCGVLALPEPAALPVTEMLAPEDEFYSFTARYAAGRSLHHCPAAIPDEVSRSVQAAAVGAHRALGLRDLSRADFLLADDGRVVLLEVNTMPGFTATSLLPEAAGVAGIAFPALCDRLVHQAFRRGPTRRNQAVSFPDAVSVAAASSPLGGT